MNHNFWTFNPRYSTSGVLEYEDSNGNPQSINYDIVGFLSYMFQDKERKEKVVKDLLRYENFSIDYIKQNN